MKQFLSVVLAVAALAIAPSAHADPTPNFGYVAPGWFTVGAFDLSAFWHQAGFQESGISYAYIGGPDQSGYAGRFDPLGTTYEAFFGAYTISNFKYASDWNKPNLHPSDIVNSANELIALGLVDQAVWLGAYGLPGAPEIASNILHKLDTLVETGHHRYILAGAQRLLQERYCRFLFKREMSGKGVTRIDKQSNLQG